MDDDESEETFAPIGGLHAIMTSKHQVASLICTVSTTNSEREDQAWQLKRRFDDRNLGKPVGFADKCCTDKAWLEKAFGEVDVFLDLCHAIQRYSEAASNKNKAMHKLFVKKVSMKNKPQSVFS